MKIEPAPCFAVGNGAWVVLLEWLGLAHGHDSVTLENYYAER